MQRPEGERVRSVLGLGLLVAFLAVGIFSILFISRPVSQSENFSQEPKLTTIGELRRNPQKFDNKMVKVKGRLVYAGIRGLPFYIEDENGELPCFPDFSWDLFLPHVGKEVMVIGVFEYQPLHPMAPLHIVVEEFLVIDENEW